MKNYEEQLWKWQKWHQQRAIAIKDDNLCIWNIKIKNIKRKRKRETNLKNMNNYAEN